MPDARDRELRRRYTITYFQLQILHCLVAWDNKATPPCSSRIATKLGKPFIRQNKIDDALTSLTTNGLIRTCGLSAWNDTAYEITPAGSEIVRGTADYRVGARCRVKKSFGRARNARRTG